MTRPKRSKQPAPPNQRPESTRSHGVRHFTPPRALAAVRRHPWTSAASLLALASLAALAALLIPGNPSTTNPFTPRTRVYTNQTACLLTDAQGTTTPAAGAAWTGMQQASKTNAERISSLPITGAQTLQNAETYLNTLALQGCENIIGAEALPDHAIAARADSFPHIHFIAITGTTTIHPPANLTSLPDTSPATITAEVTATLLGDSTSATPST